MNKMKSKNNKFIKTFSTIQIAILVFGIIAFASIVGNINLVSAVGPGAGIDPRALKSLDVFSPDFGIKLDALIDGAIDKAFAEAAGETAVKSAAGKGIIGKGLIKLGLNPGFANAIGTILTSAAWAAVAYAGAYYISKAFGAQPGQAKAIAAGAAVGVFALGVIPGVGWIAAGIGLLVTLFTWTDEKTKTAVFTCSLWQPATVKSNEQCERCNQGVLPCSEYQCNSLGVSCKILNKGTKDQRCEWINRNDISPPIITPWQEALMSGYSYINQSAVSPVDKGVRISYNSSDGCIPFYTPFSFGIQINKDSKCKADVIRQPNISKMRIPLSGERYLDEHLITLTMPNAKDLEGENIIPLLNVSGGHKLYIRCMSGNGIESNANLEFNYCVQSGPDLNPPEIRETNILNGAYVGFGVGSVNLTLSVNKPAQCRWSTLDKSYDTMENSMLCATNITARNAKMLYDCKTVLNGIKDYGVENNFYFRCNGTYNGKTNPTSYPFKLIGTEPFVIDNVGPEGTIKDATNVVKVVLTAQTSAGAEDGRGTCQYSKTGRANDYTIFISDVEEKQQAHSQELRLAAGNYMYYIRCFDGGGNSAYKNVSFNVETDNSAPVVVRAFHDRSYLKIITNEEAQCVYDTVNCNYNFSSGISMNRDPANKKEHYIEWNPVLDFFIKCKDDYNNQPARDQCSIVARPFNL